MNPTFYPTATLRDLAKKCVQARSPEGGVAVDVQRVERDRTVQRELLEPVRTKAPLLKTY